MIHKQKKNKSLVETYEIKIEDWEVYYRFGINKTPKHFIEGVYWEISNLYLIGIIISPTLNKISDARIEINADCKMDDHWQQNPTIISAKAIGCMEIPRGLNKFIFNCSVPSRSLPYLTLATQSGKIKFASISATELKWRRSTILSISLSTQREV